MSGEVILRAEHVCVEYAGRRPTRAVRDVSFELRRGEVLGIAGESGCGKSTLAYALTRMLRPPAEFTGGSIQFFGRDGTAHDVMALAGEQLRGVPLEQGLDGVPERDERAQSGHRPNGSSTTSSGRTGRAWTPRRAGRGPAS